MDELREAKYLAFGREPVVRDPSKLLSDLVVFSADLVLAIEPLEPADRKMTTGHLLEVLDERIVHRSAPKGANDRKCLRCDLLGHHQPEARGYLGDELEKDRSTLLDDPTLGNEPRSFGYGFCEHASNRKISALGRVGRSGSPAQSEDLNARQSSLRVR
jgi:hypothetical protein